MKPAQAAQILTLASIFVACKPSAKNPPDAATSNPPRIETFRRSAYAGRTMPSHTFDMLSQAVAPGEQITQTVTLPVGWSVVAPPELVGEATVFVIETAETTTNPDGTAIYKVRARNGGKTAARFIADVPCSGCP